MAHAGKRPFKDALMQTSIVIDLTDDNDDARPTKRQRSEPTSAPFSSPNNAPVAAAAAKTISTTPATKPLPNNGIDGISSRLSTSSLSNGHQNAIDNSELAHASRSELLKMRAELIAALKPPARGKHANGTQKSSTATQKKRSLVNGTTAFPIRASPTPSQRQSATAHESSRSPVFVDLSNDSDQSNKKRKPESVATGNNISATQNASLKPEASASPSSQFHGAKPMIFNPLNKPLNDGSAPHDHAATSKILSSKTAVRVNLPPTASQQQEMVRHLKNDVTFIEKKPEEVYRVLGVLPFDNTDLTKEHHEKVRQKKHQAHIDRSEISLDLDTEKPLLDATESHSYVHPHKQASSILSERFEQNDKLTFSHNFKNSHRMVHGKFQFISSYVFSRKAALKSQTPHPLRSCSCVDKHGFCSADCSCLITQLVTKIDDKDVPYPVQTYRSHSSNPSLMILSDALIDDKTHTAKIFECGDSCRCKDCMNRLVQRGRTVPLQVFETGKYGFGVRSPERILRGQFIDIYLGEVITEAEISKREAAAEEDTPSYFMSLDTFITDEKAIFYVDGANFGGVTRFVNHSCEPNCKTIPVVLPKGTKHLYYVAFFAVTDIEAGEELTIDYDPDLLGEGDAEEIVEGVVRCQCGSAKCRKRLWAPGKEKRRRKKRYLTKRDDD